MKRIACAFALLLAVTLFATASPTLAGPPTNPPPASLLVTIASPNPSPALAAGGAPSQYLDRADAQLSRLGAVLASLKKHGHLRDFAFLTDANAIRVDAPDAQAAMLLHGLPGVSGISEATTQNIQAARTSFRALLAQAYKSVASRSFMKPQPPADSPHVEVNETWDTVAGNNFPPDASVTAILKDCGGATKTTMDTTVDGTGNFWASFSPAADVAQGDSVDITVGTYSTTVHSAPITIDFDYANDRVFGTATPGRTVLVHAHGKNTDACGGDFDDGVSASVDASGNYSADFKAKGEDINRLSEADVTSYDANGNGWVVLRNAPMVIIRLSDGIAYGYAFAPNDPVTITLRNGTTIKETQNQTSNYPSAHFAFAFHALMLPGDTVEITEGGNTLVSVEIPTLSTHLDSGNKPVTGTAPQGQIVTVGVDHYNRSNGRWDIPCAQVTANALGKYNHNFGVNYIGGDDAYVKFVFDEGQEITTSDYVPYLLLYQGQNYMEGSFHPNFDGELTIAVKDSAGVTKYSGQGYAFGGEWEQILANKGLPVKLAVGDKVTVTPALPATGVLTSVVARLTAKLGADKRTISGTAPAKAYLGVSTFHWNGGGYWCDQCNSIVHTNSTGAYTFQFDRTVAQGDYADAYYIDPGGHQTIVRAFTTNPTITLKSSPSLFRWGLANPVTYTIANGMNVERISMAWDRASSPNWAYTNWDCSDNCSWPLGGPGDYTINVWFAYQGRIYFRGFAWVDGRIIFTSPEMMAPAR